MTKLTIPISLYDTACAIAQALDTDSGGAASWGPHTTSDSDGNEVTPDTYSTEGTFGRDPDTLTTMLSDPEALHTFITAEYASRWADQTPPTLADCQAFCAGAVIAEPATEVLP